jgi:hypothetical protein
VHTSAAPASRTLSAHAHTEKKNAIGKTSKNER